MISIISWTIIMIISWFHPELDIYPKTMITLATLMIIFQALQIRSLS